MPIFARIRQRSLFFNYFVGLLPALREGQVTLDAILSPDLFRVDKTLSDHDNAFIDSMTNEEQVTAGSLALQVLAHQNGGQILKRSKDLATDIRTCIADAGSYDVLSFDSPPAATPRKLHLLHVNVNKPGLTARANTAYYALQ
jgi:hypothetical protein